MEIQKESYQGHNHHKIIQIIQTGQHGQNGLPVAVVVEGPISQNQAMHFFRSRVSLQKKQLFWQWI